MKKMVLALGLMCSALPVCAQEQPLTTEFINEVFVVDVTAEQANVIEELVTTMSETSVFSLLFKKGYLKNLARKLRPVSSTQFLGYVFERPELIHHMKRILKSQIKWDSLTRSIVRGLKKEEATTLYNDLPKFAKHTRGDEDSLAHFAREGDFNGFIIHLLEQN